jgi:hypothetical protein
MNNCDVDVNPKDFITVNTANKVELRVSNLQIGISVDVTLLIKDLNGNLFKVENVHIEGEEYDNWGSDDQYLVNIVLSKVGLTQKAKESN